ncbi:hypothetical protein BJI64_04015 [Acinetobacter baumannii]|nr:hypothetical protein BJI64_04015 [Acinetobacter baumannii]
MYCFIIINNFNIVFICLVLGVLKNIDRFINLTLKKIPNSIIKACEWGHDDYSLNVQNLPMSEPDIQEKPKAKKVKNTQEQSQVTGDLFGDQT